MEVKDTRVCNNCMKDIDIDNESHFESTFGNYLCFKCGEAVIKFRKRNYNGSLMRKHNVKRRKDGKSIRKINRDIG